MLSKISIIKYLSIFVLLIGHVAYSQDIYYLVENNFYDFHYEFGSLNPVDCSQDSLGMLNIRLNDFIYDSIMNYLQLTSLESYIK